MAQHIRPAQAYAAQSSVAATSASPGPTDQRNLHRRICGVVGVPRGTTQYGTLKTTNTTQRPIVMPDLVYSALVTAGVDFSDAQYNSATAEATETTTGNIPTLWNPGLHSLVCIHIGDSLSEGPTGSGAYPDLNLLTTHFGLLGHDSALPALFVASDGSPVPYMAPERSYSQTACNAKSRLMYNVSHGGWRCTNISGWTYSQGSPHLDNIEHFTNCVLHPRQTGVVFLWIGTNDVAYGDQNGNPGMAAVPAGTPGYTYTGSINYIESSLTPLITAVKAKYPGWKIVLMTPAARGTTTPLNDKFGEIARYAVANKAALGIDVGIDCRMIPWADPGLGTTATANRTYYQSDSVHMTPFAYAELGKYKAAALDRVQSFTPDPAYAGALF